MGISTFVIGRTEDEYLYAPWGRVRVIGKSGRSHEATFAIRPEHVRLLDAPAPNAAPGIIQEVAYNGEFTAYRVALADVDVLVKVYQSTPQQSVGTQLFVQFPPEHLFEVRP